MADTFKKDNWKLSPSGDKWQLVEFTLHNEFVNTATTLNLFDSNNPVPFPTSPASAAPTIIATINVGTNPFSIAYNPVSNTMYVVNAASANVSVINCSTNTVLTTISTTVSATAIAYDSINNRMYITKAGINRVAVIDCATNTIIGGNIVVGTTPDSIAYNSSTGQMYVGNVTSNDVSVIDCSTNTVIGSPIVVGTNPFGIAYDIANDRMYVTNNISDDISVIDCSSNTVMITIALLGGTNPRGLAYNSSNNTMYVANSSTNDISIIDCATNAIIGSPIIVSGNPRNIAYNALTNIMYVTNDSGSVDIIDCSNNTVTYNVLGTTVTSGIAYNTTDDSAYFSNTLNATVSVIDSVQLFFITGTWDYNQFVRDLAINPKLVRQIVLIATGTQLAQPLQLTYKDYYGILYNTPRYPNLGISPYMNQRTISELDFDYKNKELVFDSSNYISQYRVAANSQVAVLIYYKELILSDALDLSGKILSCNTVLLNNCSEDNVTKTEKQLVQFGEPIITMEEVLNLNKEK